MAGGAAVEEPILAGGGWGVNQSDTRSLGCHGGELRERLLLLLAVLLAVSPTAVGTLGLAICLLSPLASPFPTCLNLHLPPYLQEPDSKHSPLLLCPHRPRQPRGLARSCAGGVAWCCCSAPRGGSGACGHLACEASCGAAPAGPQTGRWRPLLFRGHPCSRSLLAEEYESRAWSLVRWAWRSTQS